MRMINDAEMQGLAVIEGCGIELVLTLGIGAGTALFCDGELMPHLELSHHPITKDKNYDEHIGNAAKEKIGKKHWNKRVEHVLDVLAVVVNFDKLWIGGNSSNRSICRITSRWSITRRASKAARSCGIRDRCARRGKCRISISVRERIDERPIRPA